jgi:CheY-like chemotaxis protein
LTTLDATARAGLDVGPPPPTAGKIGPVPDAQGATPDPAAAGGRRLRVLLAEDNTVNQHLAVRTLQKRGHEVVVAANGREALDLLEGDGGGSNAPFDLVLMDVQMPEMDGFEATAAIRARERESGNAAAAHLPIIAMTAHAMKGDRERCLAEGMDGYVSKPLQSDDLVAAIDETLARLARNDGNDGNDGEGNNIGDENGNEDEPAFDRAAILDRVGGDIELLREIAGLFLNEAPVLLDGIRRALSAQDAPALERAAHSLKGSVGTFGARAAQAAAGELEARGRAGNLAGAEAIFARLAREVARFERALAALTETA